MKLLPIRISRRARRLTILVIALTMGCVSPNPSLYHLRPATVDPGTSLQARVGLRRVSLPEYAKDTRLLKHTEEGAIAHVEAHQWADTPSRAITRVLMQSLSDFSGAAVASEPWPPDFTPTATVSVHFDRFQGVPEGRAEVSGHAIISTGSKEPRFLNFNFDHPISGSGYADVMSIYAKTLAELARKVAQSLNTGPP